nr:uncharacterized protein CI109_001921 [Kwoniella shandongensis]KAA5529496.1 hypothetical protein CI109_001921 [Kwoniella shandongensis]
MSMDSYSRNDPLGRKRAAGQPLRRGDACLMCRAKKLKCSARKPVCDQCAKRKDRCVYDAVRPASRVEKLERKLAEMEEQEYREALEARRRSSDILIRGPETAFNLSYQPVPLEQHNIGIPFVPYPAPSHTGLEHCHSPLGHQGLVPPMYENLSPPLVAIERDPSPKHAMMETGPMVWQHPKVEVISPPPMTQLSATPVSQNPSSSGSHLLPWSLLNQSNDFSFSWTTSTPTSPSLMQYQADSRGSIGSDVTVVDHLSTVTDSVSPKTTIAVNPLNNHHGSFVPDQISLLDPALFTSHYELRPMNDMTDENHTGVLRPDEITSLIAGDGITDAEGELTESAKGYLLTLFFGEDPPRPHFGSEVFTEAQFRVKMLLPESEQPHPCLIYSMYTIASSHSYIPAIRSLSDTLLAKTAVKVEEAIAQGDRLVDAINATKNISKWLPTQSRWLEAYQYSWKAISLCVACGLHQIPSSIFAQPESTEELGHSTSLLPPPKHQWELCERIHAFWSAWGNERGLSLMVPWPSAIRDEIVTTPWPRPPEDFQDGYLQSQPDFNLRDAYNFPLSKRPQQLNFLFGYFFIALHLRYRAQSLKNERSECHHTYRSLDGTPRGLRVMSPKREHPGAYKEILDMVNWIEQTIPGKWKVKLTETPCWETPDVPFVFLLLLSVRIDLHPLHGDDHERELCLASISNATGLIKLWISKIKLEQHEKAMAEDQLARGVLPTSDVLLTSTRNKNGLAGPYWSNNWEPIANLSKDASQLLQSLGRIDESQRYSIDADEITQAMRSMGISGPQL